MVPRIPTPEQALPGRTDAMRVSDRHAVNGHTMTGPFPDGSQIAMFGLGCFWGAERCFWKLGGVYSTAVGYAGGVTSNPTYQEICTGLTGHNEVVRVVFDPDKIGYRDLVNIFFESHNPTQGMRQGNDVGTQYRSGIYTFSDEQADTARDMQVRYQIELSAAGHGEVSTEIVDAPVFYFAEDYHQQYLHKNPSGYCGLGGVGVSCPV